MCLSEGESAPQKWGEEAMSIWTEIHGEIEASGKLWRRDERYTGLAAEFILQRDNHSAR